MAPDLSSLDPGRRDRLLRLAAAELAEHGIEHASLNRVVTGLGMSKSSFYHHVGSKQALVEAVIDTFGTRLLELVDPPSRQALRADFWGEISALAERLLQAGDQDEVFWQLGRMWHDPALPPGRGGLHRWVTAAVEIGREVGAVGRDLPADVQVRMSVAVASSLDAWAVHAPSQEARDLLPAQVAAMRRLLTPA